MDDVYSFKLRFITRRLQKADEFRPSPLRLQYGQSDQIASTFLIRSTDHSWRLIGLLLQISISRSEAMFEVKADFQSVEFSERAEILLFAGENVALKLNR